MADPVRLASGKQLGTIIFLHGRGDTGHGWLDGLSEICPPHLKIMCPNAPIQPVSLYGGMRMSSWFDKLSPDYDGEFDEEGITKSSDRVKELIEEEVNNGIATEKIIIGGFSQGGAVALHTLMTLDKTIAGCVALSTFLPLRTHFPGICRAENKSTKVFLGHGTADSVIDYSIGKTANEVLAKYYPNLKFYSYPNMEHSSSWEEMNDIQEFVKSVLPKSE